MIYKPKYCCQCGEKIEREKWTIFSSARFCQLCETDFALREWTPRAVVALGLIFGVVGLFGYGQTTEKPLKIISSRQPTQTIETKKDAAEISGNQRSIEKASANFAALPAAPNAANIDASAAHQTAFKAKQESPLKTQEKASSDDAPTYFCGAATKKGAPCSRRVKGGGRCWQHAGQPAILPPEKLLASR